MILRMEVLLDIGTFIEASDNKSRELHSIVEMCSNRILALRGYADGKAAGSWVFDGNTDRQTYKAWQKGLATGDPEIIDRIPSPSVGGEFADNPTWNDIVAEELYIPLPGVEAMDTDDMFDVYNDAFNSGVLDEINRVIAIQLHDE